MILLTLEQFSYKTSDKLKYDGTVICFIPLKNEQTNSMMTRLTKYSKPE